MLSNGGLRMARQASTTATGGDKSSFLASNRARSREGHAAAPMGIKDDDHRWVQIQQKTFTNWVNEQLKSVGKRVEDLQFDFQDGLNLIALIEVLQGRRVGKAFQNPVNQHQMLENVQLALNAMMDDNIKLVNIGNQDIVEGNLKLVLGLIWTLILRYQIGNSNLPPKKLMLAWLQAVLPELKITNFTRDWSDGVALSGLIDYCMPGLHPNWRNLDPKNRVENLRRAMQIAEREFGIPMLISPEDLSSPDLDELSGMTYLSYFMNSANSPGYKATLRWVQSQIPEERIQNFTTDWNDGRATGALVKSLGGVVPGYSTQTYDRWNWEDNLGRSFKGGRELGVEPILTPKQMAEAVEEHLGTMAYVAWFQWVKPQPKRKGGEKIRVSGEGLHTAYVGKPAHFQVQYVDDVDPSSIRAELRGPKGVIPVQFKLGENGGSATYMPTEAGPHELYIWCEGELLKECPRKVRIHPDISKMTFSGPSGPVPLGKPVDMTVNSNGAGRGELVVEARAPSGRVVKCPSSEHNGNYSAKFQPDEVGEWLVSITYDGQHIKGSPFTCNVFDPNAVKVSGASDVGVVGQSMDFGVDASRAGKGEATVEIFYQGRLVPARIDALGNGQYKVTFTPTGPGIYTIHVYFNGVEVRGSPFQMEIYDTSTVSASGEGLKLVPVSKPAFFAISTKGATSKDLQVSVTGPNGRDLPVRIIEEGPNQYRAEYTPTEVGEHSIAISFFDKPIRGSPFKCYAYDARQIRVGHIPDGFVGEPVEFEIDGSRAGSGNLEILVNGGRVVSHVKALGNQRFLASFTPMDAMTHTVEMRFNGEVVPGSPWTVNVTDPRNVTARNVPKYFHVNRATSFEIDTANVGQADLKVEIKGPSMRSITSYTSEVRRGVYKCEFTSSEVGLHSIEVSYADRRITGSPFTTKGYDSSKIKISKITDAFVGLPVQFQVDASQAGEGQLEISINNGRVPNKVDVLGGGKCNVTFVPQTAHPHYVDVKFNGDQAPGCPIEVKVFDVSRISASGEGLERVMVGKLAKFTVNTAGAGESELKVVINSPSKRIVQHHMRVVSKVGYEVEWTAQEVGYHSVTVEYASQEIQGSPFKVSAFDPTKVKVSDFTDGFVGKPVTFTVDASEAGEGSLEIVVADSHSRQMTTHVERISTAKYQISFVPQEAIPHSIDVTFNKEPVPGTPFSVDVMDASKVQATGDGLRIAQVGKVAMFTINAKGAGAQQVHVEIQGPDGRPISARVLDNRDMTYKVEYIAQMAGEHRIMITYGGIKVGASPYIAKAFDVNAIRISEIPDGILGKPVTFTVDASQAGSGDLEVTVNNGRVQTTAESLGNNRYAITFVPRTVEIHQIDMKFNGVPIPGCPFQCRIIDASRVAAYGDGLDKVPVNVPAFFAVDPKGSPPAECEVTITSPSGRKVPVKLSGSAASTFRAEYIPTEVGDHSITVMYAGLEITGSPFLCRAYDASKVTVTQTKTGFVGKPVSFHVDASQAGAGNLEIVVSVSGKNVPNFVQAEGNARFKVTFTPQEAFPHQIRVRFNNLPVPGTPYDCEISDGSRCTASGDGLRLVPVNKPAHFTVDPRGAPSAELKITVTAPSGKTVPVNVSGSAATKFRAEYIPTEVGPHTITVLYADTPISGSPFTCNVYDASRIRVSDIPIGIVGKPVKFQVDASQAGEGKLDVTVSCNGAEVRSEIAPIGRSKYQVTFVPREVAPHFIDVQFNDTQVDGAPFRCEVIDGSLATASGDGLSSVCLGDTAWFEIDPHGPPVGDADVGVTSPTGARVSHHLRKTSRGTFRVEYVPTETGPHTVSAKYADVVVTGSPFTCNVYDPRRVRVGDLPDGYVNKEYSFRVDTASAGRAELEVNIEAGGKPVRITSMKNNGTGAYTVVFTPRDPGQHLISLTYGGKKVEGSPFRMTVHDPSLIKISGEGLDRCCVGEVAWFEIDPRSPLTADVDVKILSPSDTIVPTRISKTSRGIIRVEYTASQVGVHKISCKYADTPLTGSPFLCDAYDPRLVEVLDLKDGYVGKEMTFRIDYSAAGKGEIDLQVESSSQPLKTTVKPLSPGQLQVTFTPKEAGAQNITVKFNNRVIPNSPYAVLAYDPSLFKVSGDGLKRACVGETAWFEIEARGPGNAEAGVKITSPTGAKLPCTITKNSRGVIRIEYVPNEVGPHIIQCKYAGTLLSGSPFTCQVYDPSQVEVKDLKDGYVGKQNSFIVDASAAGVGEVVVEIEESGRRVPCEVRMTGDRVYKVSFVPRDVGPHQISVKFSSRPVPHSPFRINVVDPNNIRVSGDGLKRARVGQKAWFNVEMREGVLDADDVAINVTAPNGSKVSINRTQKGKSELRAEYVPKIAGPHRIEVSFLGQPVSGSPFVCEVYDPTKVSIRDFPDECTVGETGAFEVVSKEAGKAELSVKIFGPSGRELPVELVDSADGKKVKFTPVEAGKHKLHILYGGEETPGSPYTFMVDEAGFPTATGDGLIWAIADESAIFKVDAGNLRGKLEVIVNGPNTVAKTNIVPERNGMYRVSYLPIEVGSFDIKIMWNGKEIPGSPYHPKVFDPSKVRPVGGWAQYFDEKDRIRMRVGEEKKITFDVSEAGPGKLSAEIRGPSGLIPVKVESAGKERVRVSFTAVVEGHHDLHFWWSEQAIPHSPFPGWAEPAAILIDASRVRLRGRGLTEAKVREEAEFIIDGSDAGPGEPEVHISGLKADIAVTLQHLGNNVYKATYTAQHSGAYLLTVKWSGEVVKGCPYKLNVAAGSDASKVVVTGDMKGGAIGTDMKTFIDTRKAGPGELSVYCMGPTKQAFCELYDHRDGTYTLRIRPAEAGRHLLTIKYNGEHVPGSPFAIKIAGTPDASKVRVYGPGVNHGVLATYQSRFMCETKGAGAGQLTVRVRGPKGAFRVEMQRESQKDRTILCKYDPTEPGDYRIEVKWSGEHVPGSPFNIWIFDTEEELNRFMRTGEVPRPSSPAVTGYGPVSEYTYGNGHYSTPPPVVPTTPYSQWRRGSADI